MVGLRLRLPAGRLLSCATPPSVPHRAPALGGSAWRRLRVAASSEENTKKQDDIREIPLASIRRPLARSRSNDPGEVLSSLLGWLPTSLFVTWNFVAEGFMFTEVGHLSSEHKRVWGRHQKVKWLAESIAEIGLQEPIDVLEVEGKIYGFSGCHRYEAHQVLGKDTIKCKVIKSTPKTLKKLKDLHHNPQPPAVE